MYNSIVHSSEHMFNNAVYICYTCRLDRYYSVWTVSYVRQDLVCIVHLLPFLQTLLCWANVNDRQNLLLFIVSIFICHFAHGQAHSVVVTCIQKYCSILLHSQNGMIHYIQINETCLNERNDKKPRLTTDIRWMFESTSKPFILEQFLLFWEPEIRPYIKLMDK